MPCNTWPDACERSCRVKVLVFRVWDVAMPVVTRLRWPPLTPLIISLPISVSEHTCTYHTCDTHHISRFTHITQRACYQLPPPPIADMRFVPQQSSLCVGMQYNGRDDRLSQQEALSTE